MEARQATFCRCYHESQEQECGIHGDAHFRLVGGLADALVQVKAARMMEFATAQAENVALRDDIGNLEVERDELRVQVENQAHNLRALQSTFRHVKDILNNSRYVGRARVASRILSRALDTEKGEAS